MKKFYIKTLKFKVLLINVREKTIAYLFDKLSLIYIKTLAKKRTPWNTNKEKLLELPPNTLGYAVGRFLDKHHFSLQYKAENHDVFHVLTSYQPIVKDEIGLQFLLLGNGKRSLFLFVALFAGLLLMPENYRFFYQSYLKGKQQNSFYNWEFEHLLKEDFASLYLFINQYNHPLNITL